MKRINPEIQRRLGVTADGWKGKNTERAIKAFQKSKGLNPDGIVGPKTRAALGIKVDTNRENNLPTKRPNLIKTSRNVTELIWHCTATPEGRKVSAKEIDAWHKQRWSSGLGYHYIVHLDGSISIGRTVNKRGVHVRGRNTGTIGAVYVGGCDKNMKAKDTRTKAQKESMIWLTKEIKKLYRINKVTGHNKYAAKACPSFDVSKDQLGKV